MTRASIVDRVKALSLPAGEYIVIGSGIMEALGLRRTHDIDLVVTPALFDQLEARGWAKSQLYDLDRLMHEDAEVWTKWYYQGAHVDLAYLTGESVTVDDIMFVSPQFLLRWKRDARRPKDADDIRLLEEYIRAVQ